MCLLRFDFKGYKLHFDKSIHMSYNYIHLFYNECFHSKNSTALCGFMINMYVLRQYPETSQS